MVWRHTQPSSISSIRKEMAVASYRFPCQPASQSWSVVVARTRDLWEAEAEAEADRSSSAARVLSPRRSRLRETGSTKHELGR